MIPTLAGLRGGVSSPSAPVLSYTSDNVFTITNYDASLTYTVSGATLSGSFLIRVSNGATVRASYSAGSPASNASTMNVLANARVLTDSVGVTDTGCGPRGSLCCPGGRILDPAGNVCGGAPGSMAPDAFCGGACDGNCWQLTISCYNWYWTNYTANGYTLIGNTWGKAVNG